jgi:hypothetical protein
MLHRFYTLNGPASLSVCACSERIFRAVITDEHGYACILAALQFHFEVRNNLFL